MPVPARPIKPSEFPAAVRDGRISLVERLEAFRRCLIRSAIAVGVGMLVAFVFIDRIVTFIFAPTRHMLPAGATLVYTQPGEAFSLWINIALVTGVVFASPLIFYEIWRFIAPALYSSQKRFAIPFVLLTTTGALGGALFSHYVLFPYMIGFFGTFSTPDLMFMPRVEDVFGLYLKMLGGMVVIFQMPTFAFFLAKMGLVSASWLWKNFRYAILIIFIAAAVLTPSADPWNQTIFAAPMVGLYILSIGIAWVFGPRRKKADTAT